ncbi:DUF6076 domain-containing protein [Lacrimispora sp.]|uniref:DUF6076 domain-containing protein n=1 Tax=Lacrimispora sp. TaxID=2719234 RepID=UPI002FD99789
MWQYFAIQSLEEMLYLELMEMIKRGIRVKRCVLCDRYFVLVDKRKGDYCDRPYKGQRTCRQVGASRSLTSQLAMTFTCYSFKPFTTECTPAITA